VGNLSDPTIRILTKIPEVDQQLVMTLASLLDNLETMAMAGAASSLNPTVPVVGAPQSNPKYFKLAGETNDAPLWQGAGMYWYSDNGVTRTGYIDMTTATVMEMVYAADGTLNIDLKSQENDAGGQVATIKAYGFNSTPAEQEYGRLAFVIDDPTAGSEDSSIFLKTYGAGVLADTMKLGGGGDAQVNLYFESDLENAGNEIFRMHFRGLNSTQTAQQYAEIYAKIDDSLNDSEDGQIGFTVMKAGTLTDIVNIQSTKVTIDADLEFTGAQTLSTSTGLLTIVTDTGVIIDGSADVVQLTVQAHSTQTANIMEWEDSSGNVVGLIDERGVPTFHLNTNDSNIFIGKDAGKTTATREDNVAIGRQAGQDLTTGRFNVFLGTAAGANVTTGISNVYIGYLAGDTTTDASSNTMIGNRSGEDLTSGHTNTCVGSGAGRNLTTGVQNVFIGASAGDAQVGGAQGLAVGYNAGKNNTASESTFVGANAGLDHTSGVGVTYIGKGAGANTTTGGANTFIGRDCGELMTTGTNNTALGDQAGENHTSGGTNTYIGAQSGQVASTGSGNVHLGFFSGGQNTLDSRLIIDNQDQGSEANEITDSIIYGVMSATVASQTLRFNASVGVGVTPTAKLHIDQFSTTGAIPVLLLDQSDVSEQAIKISYSAADVDMILIDVDVTGDPQFQWDQSQENFLFTKGITIGGASPTNATLLSIEDGITFKESAAPTADAGYVKIWSTTDNELFFQSGDGATHLLHSDAFSNIWFHGSTTGAMTVEVTISTQNAMTIINSFTVVGNEDDLANVVGSSANNTLTLSAIASGEYEISYHASVTATGGADKEMMVALGIVLATPKDITDVTDDTITPIVITSTAHGLEDGDMVQILGVLGNIAANGSFIVDGKTDNTFKIVKLDGSATTGNGNFDAGSPTGDVTIEYPGNMIIHRMVRGADLGAISATGVHILANSDVLSLYVANLDGITNLTVAAVSFDAFRIGD